MWLFSGNLNREEFVGGERMLHWLIFQTCGNLWEHLLSSFIWLPRILAAPGYMCDTQMARAHTVSVMWTGSVRIAVHKDSPWNPAETSPEITWLRISARSEGRIGHSDAILPPLHSIKEQDQFASYSELIRFHSQWTLCHTVVGLARMKLTSFVWCYVLDLCLQQCW